MIILKKEELLDILERVKNGDENAYESLYRFYYPKVYRFALYISHCDADAHDIAQATMIAVHDKLYTLQKPEFFHSWIKRITINQSTKLFRKGKHVIYNDGVVNSLSNIEDYRMEANPIETLHFKNDVDLMTYFFGLLPKGQREVMELLYFEQKSMREIADTLKIPEGTVKSRIHTAKAELKTKIMHYQKGEDVSLDFKSDVLFSFLGTSTLVSSLLQPILKAKSFIGGEVVKASLITLVSISVGVGGIVAIDHISKQNESSINTLPKEVTRNTIQNKPFTLAVVEEQEIKTPQDAFFKIMTWANNEKDMQAASPQEIQEIENLLASLREYGGNYYTLLESNGWLENFNKLKK